MTYKWEWSNKLQSEMASPVDKDGYRFLLTVSPSGEYTVVKFLVKNSFNIPFSQTRPALVTKGWAESVELGKEKAELAFERFIGIKRETPVVEVTAEEPIVEESTVEETIVEEPIAEESTTESESVENETLGDFQVIFEAADNQIKVTIIDPDLEKEGVKIKYTTNGKPVLANSRNYKEPILVAPGTVINLKKTIGETAVEKTVTAEL